MSNTQQFTPPHYLPRNSQFEKKKERDSNLELLRILAMLSIIAHHYVVNSTVMDFYDLTHPTSQQYFLQIWGMWGKTSINSFILISGYFMCKMQLTWQRFFKLLIQIFFYGILIMLIFGLTGYEPLTPQIVLKQLFSLFMYINNGFVASFMVFYAFVPIYNKLINHLTKKQFEMMLVGLVFVFSICSTLFLARSMNEPFWYMTLYMIAAYIRLYPNKYFDSLKLWSVILIISVLLAVTSVFLLQFAALYFNMEKLAQAAYFFVSDSNKFLALMVGLSAFMVAKNLPVFHSKIINLASAGTFAVLLIHASSYTMIRWLWQDVCQVPNMLTANMPTLIIHALTIPLMIFAICSFIDYFYRKWIEKPLMQMLNSPNRFTGFVNTLF